MFKCVTMAKCGNIIIIDDMFNKVTALSAIYFSIIYQRNLLQNEDDDFYYLYSAELCNGKLFVGYDSKKLEVWDANTMKCTYTLEMDKAINKIITYAADP